MFRAIALCSISIAIVSCTAPETTVASLAPCEKEHVLKRLRIELPCQWQVESRVVTNDTMYRFTDRSNTVLLQAGKMWNTAIGHEADSSLRAGFSDRRIEGTIMNTVNGRLIHGSRPLRSRGGDSLFIYMEDTSRWEYYHFDGEFLNKEKMAEFISAMERSELVR